MPEPADKPQAGRLRLTRRKLLLLAPVAVVAGFLGVSTWRTDKTLTAFVDTLLPADQYGPAASATGAVQTLQSAFSGSMFRNVELRILTLWLDVAAGGSFASADPATRFQVVDRLDRQSEHATSWKIYRRARASVMMHYFGSAERALAMGLPGAPQPDGYEAPHLPWTDAGRD
ncbi:MAG: hypothetical protein AAFW74_06800 [Pseudomonadota bacterium]